MEPRSVEGCEEEVMGWLEPRRARESSDAVAARCGSGAWVCDSSDRWPAGCDDSRLDELLLLLAAAAVEGAGWMMRLGLTPLMIVINF